MPELPEFETIAEELHGQLIGRKFGNPDEILGHEGPEPLKEGFTVDELAEKIKKYKRSSDFCFVRVVRRDLFRVNE